MGAPTPPKLTLAVKRLSKIDFMEMEEAMENSLVAEDLGDDAERHGDGDGTLAQA